MKLLKEVLPYVVIVIVVVIVRTFILDPVRVDGDSMNPTLKDNQILLLKKYDKSLKRFDIVVFKYNDKRLVKRVIGLPGEHIKIIDDKLYINNNLVSENFNRDITNNFDIANLGVSKVPNDMYFVLGDNRNNSVDSRVIGFVSKDNILGVTNFSIFPLNKFGVIEK